MVCAEPMVVYPEKEFEMALRMVIHIASTSGLACAIVPATGFDMAVQVIAPTPRTIHIEVKSYGGQRQGGVGFGNGKGAGPQVDLLVDEEQAVSRDDDVRWAFADATRAFGVPRYALLSCSEARGAAMCVVARNKQNNFRLSALKNHWVPWAEFSEKLIAFIAG
jgi:hypothetical protein